MMKTFFNILQNTMKKQKIAALKNGFLFKKNQCNIKCTKIQAKSKIGQDE